MAWNILAGMVFYEGWCFSSAGFGGLPLDFGGADWRGSGQLPSSISPAGPLPSAGLCSSLLRGSGAVVHS